jgi:hypothetical protein
MIGKLAVAAAFMVVSLVTLHFGEQTGVPGGHGIIIGSAEARVGRPLTPVSVAGVARRTTRRCVTGVYYC